MWSDWLLLVFFFFYCRECHDHHLVFSCFVDVVLTEFDSYHYFLRLEEEEEEEVEVRTFYLQQPLSKPTRQIWFVNQSRSYFPSQILFVNPIFSFQDSFCLSLI